MTRYERLRHASRLPLLAVLVLSVGGCGGPVLANPAAAGPVATVEPAPTERAADPQPVVLPRDDAPHDRLTEWWYYTGHLRDETGDRWGFEFVVFRAERGGFPVTWASHLALTDETRGAFQYAQRAEIGPQADASNAAADGSGTGAGFAFAIRGLDPGDPSTFARPPWTMRGADGRDVLAASAGPGEASGDQRGAFGLALTLASLKPPVVHDGDGYVGFGPAGGSYYYSRTAMSASGTITVGDRTLGVDGTAWFDHQWGDFIAVGAGGWDWFAISLDDGTELMLSLVRATDGTYPIAYGTLVDAAGSGRTLGSTAFSVRVADQWTSPATGTRYPAGWRITVPGEALEIQLAPTVPGQELDTRATTGVVYWEGSQRVTATRGGVAIGGRAYVELTGYGPGS